MDPVRYIVRERDTVVKSSASDLGASTRSGAATTEAVPTLWVAWDASSIRLRIWATDGVDQISGSASG
jgi:hypothetical protein